MINNRIKGLEYILIPLFGLMTQSCNNITKSDIITTSNGDHYFVTMDKDSTITATMPGNPGGFSLFYQLIDTKGDGIADSAGMFVGYSIIAPKKNIRQANFLDKAEYQMRVYPEIKKSLLRR